MDPDLLSAEDVERMARAAYDHHRRRSAPADGWSDLPERVKEANRDGVRFLPVILRALGLVVDRTSSPRPDALRLTDDEVEAAARLEHLRWTRFTRSTTPDHPDLRPWSALDEETRDKDRVRVREAASVLAVVGVAVRRDA